MKALEFPDPLNSEEYGVISRALGFGRFEVLRVGGGKLQATLAGRLKLNREMVTVGSFVIMTAFTFSNQARINHRYTAENGRELRRQRAIPASFGQLQDAEVFEDAEADASSKADVNVDGEIDAAEAVNVDDI
jgi:translation initiation factor IF-1